MKAQLNGLIFDMPTLGSQRMKYHLTVVRKRGVTPQASSRQLGFDEGGGGGFVDGALGVLG
ncbi:MAG: hypothetical protein IKT79_07760 [Akkermansia sp.]|nr:hypothetical protein [Akkermansia sp.]